MKAKHETVVRNSLKYAKAITWDECHKIYVAMDDAQVDLLASYGYAPIVSAKDHDIDELLALLDEWYADSCGLRFIQAVHTVDSDPNAGFVDLIPQCYEED